jgi:TPR repeat protein
MSGEFELHPELEQNELHLLPYEQLKNLTEPEALFERGFRLFNGQDGRNAVEGKKLIQQAAESGHRVAVATSYLLNAGVERDPKRAIELFRQSARSGHPTGNFALIHELS